MARRELQEINAGSMADIAFLLLIFFLVTTTMDTDAGIARMLPPPVPPDQEIDQDNKVKDRNVFVVLVNRNDQLMVEGEVTKLTDLREKTIEFLVNPNNEANLPETKTEDVDLIGTVEVTKGIISLQNDNGTSYKMFLNVLNELTAAGNQVKEDAARKYFGKSLDELSKDEKDAINDVAPAIISEAEPKKIG